MPAARPVPRRLVRGGERQREHRRGAAPAQLAGGHGERPAAEAHVVDQQARARRHVAGHPEGPAQQVANVRGAFRVAGEVPAGACLLVDDVRFSGWTLAMTAGQLRRRGASAVFPLALATAF